MSRRRCCDDSDGRRKKIRKMSEDDMINYLENKLIKASSKIKSRNVSAYSNHSNPFLDSNLDQLFVWRKKILRDVSQGVPLQDFSLKAEEKRHRERMAEIEKVKERREQRAIQKAQHEEEMALLARERARAELHDLEKKEQEFQFDQCEVRSQIRLREGRLKPIDILTKHLQPSDDMGIEINEPYTIFKGLTIKEMEELHADIKMYLDFDTATPAHIQYWEALLVVCDWELTESRKKDALDQAQLRGERLPPELLVEDRGLHPSVQADVKNLLQGKTYSELAEFQTHIESDMRSGTAKVVEYWETVLKQLHIFKAKACLKEIHAHLLRKHLVRLEQSSNDKATDLAQEQDDIHEEKGVRGLSPEPVQAAGSVSPQLLHGDDSEEVIDPEEDWSILENKRIAVLEERRNQQMASRTMPEDSVLGSTQEVNVETLAESEVYWLHDKYQPRKPMYLNRVHTGYEWNKYNRTHYDHDNPPPKTVQGYKFNIFYPDLVDKSRAPTYLIEKDETNTETCIIKFHAGPPYQDVAFRIVNKDWEYSRKKGYKCTFDRGVLQLYFTFKRYSYRR